MKETKVSEIQEMCTLHVYMMTVFVGLPPPILFSC